MQACAVTYCIIIKKNNKQNEISLYTYKVTGLALRCPLPHPLEKESSFSNQFSVSIRRCCDCTVNVIHIDILSLIPSLRCLPAFLCMMENKKSWQVFSIQWNLRIKDTLGTGLLSFVETLSLSRRLSLNFIVSTKYNSLNIVCHKT